MLQPFGLKNPRALPWAGMLQPFGLMRYRPLCAQLL
jgi:hypothetical protein